MRSAPPPIIATSKLIKFADASAPVIFTGKQTIYLDGILVGAVPGIAICQHIPDHEMFLYLCDENWDVIAINAGESLIDLTNKAERWYDGISKNWVESPYSDEDCMRYLEKDRGDTRCSFCRRWDWEYSVLFSDNKCNICDICIKTFFSELANIESEIDSSP